VPESDFRSRRSFPGTIGGPFELFVRYAGLVQRIPGMVFAGLLLVWAWLLAGQDLDSAVLLWAFFLLDWLSLALLPRFGRSYGPPLPAVLMLALIRAPLTLVPNPWNWVSQVMGSALILLGLWVEPQRLVLTRQTLVTPKLKRGSRIRLLQFGDLHMERITPRDRKLVTLIKEASPDLICFTGDLLSYAEETDPTAVRDARAIFRQLQAPMGIYAVRGSPPVDTDEVVEAVLAGLPVHVLEGEFCRLGEAGQTINLMGAACTHKPFVDGPIVEEMATGLAEGLNILLYHSPDIAPIAARAGVDLQLSGHTHGGQVRLPILGALYASSLYGKRFESGRYQVGSMTLYVSRGLGMEGMAAPRVRFLCPPEVVVWELVGSG
jgi:predicted MPP superfamily phosphohydrolase